MTASAEQNDVVIRNCVVQVVRRGGWSWGPEPDQLARRVVQALPALLAGRFDDELANGEDVEITEPVRLVVSVSLADLLAGFGVDEIAAELDLSAAPPDEPMLPPTEMSSVVGPDTALPDHVAAATRREPDLAGLVRLLASRGELALLLALLPEEYRAALVEPGQWSQSTVDGPVFATESLISAALPGAPARALADDIAPLLAPGARPAGEVEVASALPFLLASALHRIGLLDAIGPVLAGAGVLADGPLFAAALAYKVLGVPGRGWLRAPPDRVTAAAFAGLSDEVPEEALVDFARRATPALPMLCGLVATSLCRGHEAGRPLLLAQAHEGHGGGLLLVEPDGLFPIAWVDDVAALLPYWEACGRPVFLVGGGSLGATAALAPVAVRHTRELAAARVPLVSDTPPTRGERWLRLAGPRRFWGMGLAEPPAGIDLATLTTTLDELVALMAVRRAVPLAEARGTTNVAFERTLTLIATLGLGTIAWLLWRHREPPDPQLALARLGDLGALVRFEADAVRVRLPLGQRHTDLLEHDLLADVPDVVWLGGRTLTFSGG
jgi:hypothetical protein